MNDILTRTEVELLVNRFYDQVKADELLAPTFAHVDWPHHLPVMYNFWASILLGDQSYQGNPMSKHFPLKIDREHFTRWLQLFMKTVDENFSGPVANEAKNRANTIAQMFQYKMGLME
jgi:hemoglobin